MSSSPSQFDVRAAKYADDFVQEHVDVHDEFIRVMKDRGLSTATCVAFTSYGRAGPDNIFSIFEEECEKDEEQVGQALTFLMTVNIAARNAFMALSKDDCIMYTAPAFEDEDFATQNVLYKKVYDAIFKLYNTTEIKAEMRGSVKGNV
jgi:hypothetical protein